MQYVLLLKMANYANFQIVPIQTTKNTLRILKIHKMHSFILVLFVYRYCTSYGPQIYSC